MFPRWRIHQNHAEEEPPMENFAALVAIDWADKKHAVSLYDQTTGHRQQAIVNHTPEALQQWALDLRARFQAQPIAVCLEQSRGPLIYALLKYDFLVLYPINPTTLARYRQAFSPALGKDDPSDADYLLDLLQHHFRQSFCRVRRTIDPTFLLGQNFLLNAARQR
jgi:Transposase